jgi:Ca2+-binding RTX toxin-like protein
MVTFINDEGAAIINIGGMNPPSITEATSGINARPIIANEPIAGEAPFFDRDEIILTPLTAPGGGVSLAPIPPITGNPTAIGISDFEPFECDLSGGELTSTGTVDYRSFPLFQYGGNLAETDFNSIETGSVNPTQLSNDNASDDLLVGGIEDDQLQGFLGNDTIFGNYGDDTLWGGQGNDTLNGNEGNDVLSGDRGQDILTGGLGWDTFILSAQTATLHSDQGDVITDFIVGEDQVKLSDGVSVFNINLVSNFLFDTLGTLIIEKQSNLILGFISTVPTDALWNSITT